MNIEELAAQLRRLYCEREETLQLIQESGSPRAAGRWFRAAARYDRALVQAANLLEVPAPALPKMRRIFGTAGRLGLEADLAEAGLDVTDYAA